VNSILFRADANTSIGMGDLMSVIYLSEYFDDWIVYFIVRKSDEVKVFLKDKNISNITLIGNSIDINKEVQFINQFIMEFKINILFLAITERPYSEYSNLYSKVKKACVNHYSYNNGSILNMFDLVIDWDILAEKKYNINLYKNTNFLLSPKYTILPKIFFTKNDIKRTHNKTKKLLISMGGGDAHNLTKKIVKHLIENNAKYNVTIIAGAGYPYQESLLNLLSNSNLKYIVKRNISNMFEEYLFCDIAIVAGGLTASEVVASKTPSLLIATEKHQIDRCKYFHNMKLVKYLGYRSFNKQLLIKNIDNIKNPCSRFNFSTHSLKTGRELLLV
jgi:spore coat polysaccharide biosynthesis predicted glycosyltransferase SpsG